MSGKITLAKAIYVSVKTVVDNFNADLASDTAIPDLLGNLNGVDDIELPPAEENAIYVLIPKKDKRLKYPKEFCSQMCDVTATISSCVPSRDAKTSQTPGSFT